MPDPKAGNQPNQPGRGQLDQNAPRPTSSSSPVRGRRGDEVAFGGASSSGRGGDEVGTRSKSDDPMAYLRTLIGKETPGGCSDCSAFQTVRRDRDGIFRLTVHHDESCPWLAARNRRRRR